MRVEGVPGFAPVVAARPRQRLGSFLAGMGVNVALAAVLASIHFTPALRARKVGGILLAPVPARADSAVKPVPKRAAVKLPPVPKAETAAAPRVEPVILAPPAPVVAARPEPKMSLPAVAAPRRPAVVTGAFSSPASPPPPAAAATAAPVVTGGFSAAPPVSAVPAAPAARIGSFAGASSGTSSRAAGTVQSGGFEAARTAGSDAPARTVVAGAGFGGSSEAPQRRSAPVPAAASAAFGAVEYGAVKDRPPRAAAVTNTFQSVEIVTKPKPEYTAEARKLRIEGEVWLEVLFAADGTTRVRRVVQSLGHGLDESAIAAAGRIRFHPARDGNRPVDQVATVRVQFQLAE